MSKIAFVHVPAEQRLIAAYRAGYITYREMVAAISLTLLLGILN